MRKILTYIVSLVILVVFSCDVGAQQKNQARVSNALLMAVDDYQAGETLAAKVILDKINSVAPENDAAWYYRALCAVDCGELDLAEECLLKATRLDPANFWYRQRLAVLYSMTDRAELAIDVYEKLLKDFPKKSDLYLELVELYVAMNEGEKALATIKEIETVFGVAESTTVYRYTLLLAMDRKEEAYKVLEEYNSKYSSPYVLSLLADSEASSYNDSTALAYYKEALDVDPSYTPALVGKAELLRMTLRYGDYFEALDDLVENSSDGAVATVRYMTALIRQVDADFMQRFRSELDNVVGKTVEKHPADTGVLRLAGTYYLSTGRKEMAKTAFRRNRELNPDVISTTDDYLQVLLMYSDWKELLQTAQEAHEYLPHVTDYLQLAGFAAHNLKEYDTEIEMYDRILEHPARDTSIVIQTLASKGDLYYQLGDSKKSFKMYESALKIDPECVYVLNNYAYFLSLEKKNLKKACAMSKKTVEAEPDSPTYLDTYGWILYLLGRPEEAKTHFKRAMLYGGKDSVVILDHYAEVLFALGEYEKAMVYWNTALRKNNGEIDDLESRVEERKRQMK